MKSLVKVAETLSRALHQGQKYGTEKYFEYHIQSVVNSLKLHSLY